MKTGWRLVGLLWLASLPILTAIRVPVWSDELALWQSAAWWGPWKVRPRVQIATLEHKHGDLIAAEFDYEWAMDMYLHRDRPPHERVGCRVAALNLSVLKASEGDWRASNGWAVFPCASGSSRSR